MDEIERKKRRKQSIIFNIAETCFILFGGLFLHLELYKILIIMLTFMLSRFHFGIVLHFKDWYRCLFWSLLILVSLFCVLKMNLLVAILFTIFSAYIMTEQSNIEDMYLWSNHGEPSKYQDIMDFLNNSPTEQLQVFENILKKFELEYKIYTYRFKEHKSFEFIARALDLSSPKIVVYLDKIAFAIKVYFNLS